MRKFTAIICAMSAIMIFAVPKSLAGGSTTLTGDVISQSADGNIKVEGESILPYVGKDEKANFTAYQNKLLSGGGSLYIENKSTEQWQLELTYKINISESGIFNVNVSLGNQWIASWYSPLAIKIDNGQYETIDGNGYAWTANVTDNPLIKNVKRKSEVILREGEHSITVLINTQRTGGGYYSYLDSIDFSFVRSWYGEEAIKLDDSFIKNASTNQDVAAYYAEKKVGSDEQKITWRIFAKENNQEVRKEKTYLLESRIDGVVKLGLIISNLSSVDGDTMKVYIDSQ